MHAALSILVLVLPCTVTAQSFLSSGLARFAGIDTSTLTGDNGPAYYAAFQATISLARDSSGNIYLGDAGRIRKIDTQGIITTIAGNGTVGEAGDGGPAGSAEINYALAMAIDSKGTLYFAEQEGRIRRITPDGIISTFAGTGDGKIAPVALAVDAHDRLYFADQGHALISVVGNDGAISGFAGTGASGRAGEGGPALQAQLIGPYDLAFDSVGNLYIADAVRLVKVDTHGILTRIAGDPSLPDQPSPDEVPAIKTPVPAIAVATDRQGNIFVASPRIRKITPDGIIHAFAGSADSSISSAFSEACGNALQATVYAVRLNVDANGDVFLVNLLANRLQEVTPAGKISTIAGAGPNLFTGDGGPAVDATFANPGALAFDSAGNLFVADTGNNRIRKIDTSGVVSTIAGDGGPVYNQDSACLADQDNFLRKPQGVAVDAAGNLYIADTGKNRVVKIAADGTETSIGSHFSAPQGVLADGAGDIFVTDTGNSALRKIASDGTMTTLWTGGAMGSMALDTAGNLYFSAGMSVERLSAASGAISTVAGTGEYNFTFVPGFGSFPEEIGAASALTLDSAGSIYIADAVKKVIQRVSHNCAVSEDGGSILRKPSGLALDAHGNLYISDLVPNVIWIATPTPSPANEQPTPLLGFDAIQSAAPANLIILVGEPPPPPLSAPIAPGELLIIRGACIGPFEPISLSFSGGRLSTSAGGTEIKFNGLPAPLIYVSAGEITTQAPYGLDGQSSATVTLTFKGVANSKVLAVQAANPALFTTTNQPFGLAIALNPDGTLNSGQNPVHAGSALVLYATGTGQTLPAGAAGSAPSSSNPPRTKLPVIATIGNKNADVLYAGDAPGFVGLTQVNLRVPASITNAGAQPIELQVGPFVLNQNQIYIYVTP